MMTMTMTYFVLALVAPVVVLVIVDVILALAQVGLCLRQIHFLWMVYVVHVGDACSQAQDSQRAGWSKGDVMPERLRAVC